MNFFGIGISDEQFEAAMVVARRAVDSESAPRLFTPLCELAIQEALGFDTLS